MVMELTQLLRETSTRNIYWWGGRGCKGGRCVGLTTLLPSCADCLDIWEPQPPGTFALPHLCHCEALKPQRPEDILPNLAVSTACLIPSETSHTGDKAKSL